MPTIQNFVVLEGGDGSGTTTQLELLGRRFSSRADLPPLHTTFEPSGGPIGSLIRQALRGTIPLRPETLARLFAADRNEHLHGPDGIAERAGRSELVVSDRYVLSSLVYQGIDCGEELPRLLNGAFPLPELLLFFDLDAKTAQKRLETRKAKDIYEYLEFQLKVRERYRSLLPWYREQGAAVAVIDASRKVEEVAEEVWGHIQKLPIINHKA